MWAGIPGHPFPAHELIHLNNVTRMLLLHCCRCRGCLCLCVVADALAALSAAVVAAAAAAAAAFKPC
jgi:hypothetical protein